MIKVIIGIILGFFVLVELFTMWTKIHYTDRKIERRINRRNKRDLKRLYKYSVKHAKTEEERADAQYALDHFEEINKEIEEEKEALKKELGWK